MTAGKSTEVCPLWLKERQLWCNSHSLQRVPWDSCSISLPSFLDRLLQISLNKSLVQDFPSQALLWGRPAQADTVSSGETFPDHFPSIGTPGMAAHSSVLAWRIHEQRSLAGGGPWGHKESDTTEGLAHTHLCLWAPHWVLKSPTYRSVSHAALLNGMWEYNNLLTSSQHPEQHLSGL